jgi:hypothetical protein
MEKTQMNEAKTIGCERAKRNVADLAGILRPRWAIQY